MGFNKQKLLQMMAQPSSISEKELEELDGAVADYPYFQLGHTFIAKVKHDTQAPDAYESLSHAAIYAPSRRLLRQIFYNDIRVDLPDTLRSTENQLQEERVNENQQEGTTMAETESSHEVVEDSINEPQQEVTTAEPESRHEEVEEKKGDGEPDAQLEEITPEGEEEQPTSTVDDTVHQELEENLKRLRALREQSEEQQKSSEEENDKKKVIAEKEEVPLPPTYPGEEPATEKETSSDSGSPYLLDYLKDIEPIESERLGINQKRQRELIDKFMTSERDVRIRWRIQEQSPQDLSEKNVEAPDSFATENLAFIYVKQGKKDKAIQIYEQLSLKNPQKKTYFAEKIESLKEK